MSEVTKMERNDIAHEPPQTDPMVSMIERVVMDPQADLAKLERMLDMRERVEAREARRAFDQAIAEAKKEIGPISRTGEVEYTNDRGKRTHFKHETLDGIAAAIDPILSANGLSYRFRSEQKEGMVHVTCIIAHRDGHSEETTLQGSPDTSGSKNNYQAVGSAVTYLQRYTLKLALGLSAARDDDGKGAETKSTITEVQLCELRDLIEASGANLDKFLLAYQAPTLEQFPSASFEKAKAQLLRKKEQANA